MLSAKHFFLWFLIGILTTLVAANYAFRYARWIVPLDVNERISIAKREEIRNHAIPINKSKTTVVVLGDSRITCGLIPDEFDRATLNRTSTINLALTGHGLERQYFQLKDFTETYGAPDFLILEIRLYPGITGEFGLGATAAEMVEYARQDRDGFHHLLQNFLPALFEAHYFSDLLDGRRLQELRQKRVEDQKAIQAMNLDRGVYWWDDRHRALPHNYRDKTDDSSTSPPSELSPTVMPSLKRLFNYAQEKGIKILLVTTPFREGAAAPFGKMPPYFNEVLHDYGNVRIAKNGWQAKFYPSEYFFYDGHVNFSGAKIFTDEIAVEFLEAWPR